MLYTNYRKPNQMQHLTCPVRLGKSLEHRTLVAVGDWRWRSRGLLFRCRGLVFSRRCVRRVHVYMMLADLLLEGDDILEIHDWRPGQRALHEFQPNGKCSARAGFFFSK